MQRVTLEVPPVGARILREEGAGREQVPLYRGISYCDAVRRATQGEELLVPPHSITTCKWAPVVLGLKEPRGRFEMRLSPRLERVEGVHLAPLYRFEEIGEAPDVVILRDKASVLRGLISALGEEAPASLYAGEMDKSALGALESPDWRTRATSLFNRALALVSGRAWFERSSALVFRSTVVSDLFDRFISLFTADMSMCRNSTVIPCETGRANISYFCSGGITWGQNRPDNLTSGFPYGLYERLGVEYELSWREPTGTGSARGMPGGHGGARRSCNAGVDRDDPA